MEMAFYEYASCLPPWTIVTEDRTMSLSVLCFHR